MFENHRKSLIQHCERSELRLHFEFSRQKPIIYYTFHIKIQFVYQEKLWKNSWNFVYIQATQCRTPFISTIFFLFWWLTHWYLISTVIKMKLSSLVTYIFEIYSLRPFQRGITWAKKFANSWDSDSQLLEVSIKMSPDGANFWYKCF